MSIKTSSFLILVFTVLSFAIGGAAYPALPEHMASHWNLQGEVDGTMPKLIGTFLVPLLMSTLFFVFLAIPRIDPLARNIKLFERSYNTFWVFLTAFLFAVFLFTTAWNLGFVFNLSLFVIPPVAILVYAAGHLTENSKRNWFVGIRTPWTLYSDEVWERTNRMGGRLFKVVAFFSIAFLLVDTSLAFVALVFPLVVIAAWSILYSYLVYRQLGHSKSKETRNSS